jgi:RND family efflux transporter MFP subunit
MKKLLFALTGIVLILSACSSNNEEKIREDIVKKKQKVGKLKSEITKLEEKLASMGAEEEPYKVPVIVKSMKPDTFRHFVEISGIVEAVNEAYISPEMMGQVDQIHVAEGTYLKKGALIISLNTDVIQSNIQEAKTALDLAEKTYTRQKKLWDQEIGSEIQYLQSKTQYESAKARLESLQAQLSKSQIRAPFNGIVDKIYVKEGELANVGRKVADFVNLNKIRVTGAISESYLTKINEGKTIDVFFPSLDSLHYRVPIKRVGNIIDAETRTFEIETQLNNRNGRIKPNLMASIRINDFTSPNALTVPSIVVKKDKTGSYLFRTSESDTALIAEKVYVQPGLAYQDETMIESGISKGDQVIVRGYNMVSKGSRIEIKNVK